jgi:transcriptional regulator with XRE-family HTH domain
VNASQVLDGRLALGWSRAELSQASGLSQGVINRIERTGTKTQDEHDAIARVFERTLADVLNGREVRASSVAALRLHTNDGVTRSNVWRGLRAGDSVRLRGEGRLLYHFRFHHVDPKQEYVEVYGPPKKPKLRCVPPDRVLAKNGAELAVEDA